VLHQCLPRVGRGGDQTTVFGEEEGRRAAHLRGTGSIIQGRHDGASDRPMEAAALLFLLLGRRRERGSSRVARRLLGHQTEMGWLLLVQCMEKNGGLHESLGRKYDRNKRTIFEIFGS
jgi:hypothetical protein